MAGAIRSHSFELANPLLTTALGGLYADVKASLTRSGEYVRPNVPVNTDHSNSFRSSVSFFFQGREAFLGIL